MISSSDMDIMLLGYDLSMVTLNIGNSTKNDNGIEYQFFVTNRFGRASGTTRLNITCNDAYSITLCILMFLVNISNF